jgi:hypothetical protein
MAQQQTRAKPLASSSPRPRKGTTEVYFLGPAGMWRQCARSAHPGWGEGGGAGPEHPPKKKGQTGSAVFLTTGLWAPRATHKKLAVYVYFRICF